MSERKKIYKSAETKARQLAGLSGVSTKKHTGVELEKVNGKGHTVGIPDDIRKACLDMLLQEGKVASIANKLGISENLVNHIKELAIDQDPVFRAGIYKNNLRERLRAVVEGSADRLQELMPGMGGKEAALALGISFDKLMALDKSGQSEQLHQHVHLHAPTDIANGFLNAIKGTNAKQ